MSLETNNEGSYRLEVNQEYLDFQNMEVVERDESKSWKPPVKVKVVKSNGSEEVIAADTPFFMLEDSSGNRLSIVAAVANHIESLHIKGEDTGSRFDHKSLYELFADLELRLPEGIAIKAGVSDLSLEMNKAMGSEGLASIAELLNDGVIETTDVEIVKSLKDQVFCLNKKGTSEERKAFVEKFQQKHIEAKVQLRVFRDGEVILPVVSSVKRPTTRLFMVWRPVDEKDRDRLGDKTLRTACPGRWMPKHPIPSHFEEDGYGADSKEYREAQEAWFQTVVLVD